MTKMAFYARWQNQDYKDLTDKNNRLKLTWWSYHIWDIGFSSGQEQTELHPKINQNEKRT